MTSACPLNNTLDAVVKSAPVKLTMDPTGPNVGTNVMFVTLNAEVVANVAIAATITITSILPTPITMLLAPVVVPLLTMT